MASEDFIKDFKTLIIVRISLIFLYLALTFPIPFIVPDQLKIFSIICFIFGLLAIIELTNDYVKTDKKGIFYKTNLISRITGNKSWQLLWKDIKEIRDYQTSQGSKVYYFVNNEDNMFLVPNRINNLSEFSLLIKEHTEFKSIVLNYISPFWTYKLLFFLSALMFITEIISFISYQY